MWYEEERTEFVNSVKPIYWSLFVFISQKCPYSITVIMLQPPRHACSSFYFATTKSYLKCSCLSSIRWLICPATVGHNVSNWRLSGGAEISPTIQLPFQHQCTNDGTWCDTTSRWLKVWKKSQCNQQQGLRTEKVITEMHSENQRSFLALMSMLSLSSSCLISRDTLPQSSGGEPGTIAVSAETHLSARQSGISKRLGAGRAALAPVFPIIFSHGWSVTMLSSRGEMRGVRDHSLTVLSLLQLAMVKGQLWWQVKPADTRTELVRGYNQKSSKPKKKNHHRPLTSTHLSFPPLPHLPCLASHVSSISSIKGWSLTR